MAAGQHIFACVKGATFRRTLTWKAGASLTPVNVTNYTGRMQIRQGGPSGTLRAELNSTVGHDGTITFGTTDGVINLLLPESKTALLAPGAYEYDLFVTAPSGGDTTALLQGTFHVIPAVSHD